MARASTATVAPAMGKLDDTPLRSAHARPYPSRCRRLAGLDNARRAALIPHLLRLRDEAATPMIVVSHDRRDVEALCQDTLEIVGGRRVS